MDIKSPEERSLNMSKIKNKRTKPEMYIRSLLHRRGLRYRVNCAALPGKPDLYFSTRKVAVFVHGCYWHRHPGCKYAYTPKSNQKFWIPKLEGNRRHDEQVIKQLCEQGIRVLVIWECTIKQMEKDMEIQKRITEGIMLFLNTGNESIRYL